MITFSHPLYSTTFFPYQFSVLPGRSRQDPCFSLLSPGQRTPAGPQSPLLSWFFVLFLGRGRSGFFPLGALFFYLLLLFHPAFSFSPLGFNILQEGPLLLNSGVSPSSRLYQTVPLFPPALTTAKCVFSFVQRRFSTPRQHFLSHFDTFFLLVNLFPWALVLFSPDPPFLQGYDFYFDFIVKVSVRRKVFSPPATVGGQMQS